MLDKIVTSAPFLPRFPAELKQTVVDRVADDFLEEAGEKHPSLSTQEQVRIAGREFNKLRHLNKEVDRLASDTIKRNRALSMQRSYAGLKAAASLNDLGKFREAVKECFKQNNHVAIPVSYLSEEQAQIIMEEWSSGKFPHVKSVKLDFSTRKSSNEFSLNLWHNLWQFGEGSDSFFISLATIATSIDLENTGYLADPGNPLVNTRIAVRGPSLFRRPVSTLCDQITNENSKLSELILKDTLLSDFEINKLLDAVETRSAPFMLDLRGRNLPERVRERINTIKAKNPGIEIKIGERPKIPERPERLELPESLPVD